jgi:hypothetical protein
MQMNDVWVVPIDHAIQMNALQAEGDWVGSIR